jgi:hypothetical protein
MKDCNATPRQKQRQTLAWTLLAAASFLLANAWLVARYLGPVA